MDISTEFPDFDDYNGWWSLFFKLKEHGFKDECWHNETCPQVCKNIPTAKHPERFVRVWLDWKDPNRSEIYPFYKKHDPKYKRYVVQCGNEYGDGVFLDLMLDNEDDAVRYAKQVATVFCE